MARSQVECASERDVYARKCIAIARYNDGMCAFRLCAVRYIVIGGGSMCALHVPHASLTSSHAALLIRLFTSLDKESAVVALVGVGKRTNERTSVSIFVGL